jgi:hypothetical protein
MRFGNVNSNPTVSKIPLWVTSIGNFALGYQKISLYGVLNSSGSPRKSIRKSIKLLNVITSCEKVEESIFESV